MVRKQNTEEECRKLRRDNDKKTKEVIVVAKKILKIFDDFANDPKKKDRVKFPQWYLDRHPRQS